MTRTTLLAVAAAAIAAALLGAAPAKAGECYEGIGCMSTQHFPMAEVKKLGCQNLWYVRNRAYKDNGYCFKTATGIAELGNAGCSITNQAAVPLNGFERSNIAKIRSVEKMKGCNYGG